MDPVIGAAIANASGKVGTDAADEVGSLFSRVLGPSADEIGEALRRYTEYRLRNVGRIVENADLKAGDQNRRGQAPPRVAHQLLEDGSYCDNELMVEYLGGVLAASRTPDGRDDRAVVWAGMVSRMSALEVRAHFMLYRAWQAALHESEAELGTIEGKAKIRLHAEGGEFIQLLAQDSGVNPVAALGHALPELRRAGLIETYAWGSRETLSHHNPAFDFVVIAEITVVGIELFGWAMGLTGLSPPDFIANDAVDFDQQLPKISTYEIPGLRTDV